MANVSIKKILNVSLNKAWLIIRDFSHVNLWVHDVKQIEVFKIDNRWIRKLVLIDDSKVTEELIKLDDINHIISYKSLETELPFKDYLAIIEVKAVTNETCEVIWDSTYTLQGMEEQTANQLLKTNYLRYLKTVEDIAK